jgi:hypothetical protein
MSKRYKQEVADLSQWFLDKMAPLPPLKVSQAQVNIGTDMLKGQWKTLVKTAFDSWLNEREYELSYNQMNVAFWWAAKECGKLEVATAT